jgi:hypothetical protein
VTSGGWERTIGGAQSVPSNVGERKRLHTSETLHFADCKAVDESAAAIASLQEEIDPNGEISR